jgi:hypothetical protein
MEKVINEITSHLKGISDIRYKLHDKEYWINRAKEEAGFIPREGDWISVDITIWHIKVSVYHKHTDHHIKEARYWFNGEWFDRPFPEKYPDL